MGSPFFFENILLSYLKIHFDDAGFSCGCEQDDKQWSDKESEESDQLQTDEHRDQSRKRRQTDLRTHHFGFYCPPYNQQDQRKHRQLGSLDNIASYELIDEPGC